MGEHSYSASAHGTSCALRHYFQQKRGKNDYDGLSRSQCLAAFQDWIANIRGECPDISMKEKLMCPMLWCRANCFEDHESLLKHTANCKHLSDTWYWCPHCTRPERFTGGGHWRGPIPGPAVKRTGSKIKAWLKDLGRKNTTKVYEAPASQHPNAADFSVLPFGLSQKSEMDGLPSFRRKMEGLPSVRSEMEGSLYPTYFSKEKKIANPVNELSGSLVEQFELPNPEDLALPELASAECASRRESSGRSSQWSPATEEHFSDHMVSTPAPPSLWDLKFRPLDHRTSGSEPSNTSLSLQQVNQKSAVNTPGEVAATSVIAATSIDAVPEDAIASSDPTTTNIIRPISNAASSSDSTSVSEAKYVQDLRNAFSEITVEWRKTLAPEPDLLARCSVLSTQTLFETGIVTLFGCFKGVIANTFQEIFAAMVLACASAYMSHYEGYAMNDFFHHMLPWHHALASEGERRLFLRVIDRLGYHQGFLTTSSNERKPSNTQALTTLLKNGRIITDCSRFLDDLEYASIQERNGTTTPDKLAQHTSAHTPGIRWMVKYLTGPLHQHPGIEAFQHVTDDAQRQVGCGLLRSPREVEVALKSTAKHCSRSSEMYEKYHDAVTTYCNLAVQETNSYWRDRYYATAFHKILAISWNIDNRATLVSPFARPWPDISAFASNSARPSAQEHPAASIPPTSSPDFERNSVSADSNVSPNKVYPTVVADYSTHDTLTKITRCTSTHSFSTNSSPTDRDAKSLFSTTTAPSELDSSPISPTVTTPSLIRIPSGSSGSPISPISPTGVIVATSKTSSSPSPSLRRSLIPTVFPTNVIHRSRYTFAPPSQPLSVSHTSPPSLIDRSNYTSPQSPSPSSVSHTSPTSLIDRSNNTSLPSSTPPSFLSSNPPPTLTTRPNNPSSPPSSTSPSSPSRSREKIKCPSCPATFEPTYGARYLERHLKYTKVHGNITSILCSEPGCGSIFGRKDNLDRHLQEKHHGTLRQPSRGSRKRKRVEERDLVVDGEAGASDLMDSFDRVGVSAGRGMYGG